MNDMGMMPTTGLNAKRMPMPDVSRGSIEKEERPTVLEILQSTVEYQVEAIRMINDSINRLGGYVDRPDIRHAELDHNAVEGRSTTVLYQAQHLEVLSRILLNIVR